MNSSEKKNLLLKILKKNKKNDYNKIIKYKGNLLDDNILDSFDIIEIIAELERITGKKINPNKITKKYFQNIENMTMIIK